MNDNLIQSAKEYLIESFTRNPSYSFGDGTIMVEHSIHVCEIAENLTVYQECDLLLIQIGSLFHDLGKSHLIDGKAVDKQILRSRHEQLNIDAAHNFFKNQELSESFIESFAKLFDSESDIVEKSIIKDADIIEFYMNFRLQKALNDWALDNNIQGELQRKADKFNTVLTSQLAKKFAQPYWETMLKRWNLKKK